MENPNYQQIPPPQSFPPPMYGTHSSTLAIVSLIAGILGWIGLLGIGPIVAIITGHMAKNEIKQGSGQITGGGMATAGLILGYVNLGLSIIALCLVLVFFVIAPLIFISTGNN